MIRILQTFTAVELIYGIYHDTHLQPFTQPFYNHVLSMMIQMFYATAVVIF